MFYRQELTVATASKIPHTKNHRSQTPACQRKAIRSTLPDGCRTPDRTRAPWHAWLDPAKWNAHLQRVRALPIDVIASCHAPVIGGRDIDRAFAVLGRAPQADPWPEFSQHDLDGWMAAAGIGAP